MEFSLVLVISPEKKNISSDHVNFQNILNP